MTATAETISRPVNTKMDQLLDIVGLMQSTIDLTYGQSHRGSIVPIDYPKVKDLENDISYGIKVEYKEKDYTGTGSGISKVIFSKYWTEDSVSRSVEVALDLVVTFGPRLQRVEKEYDLPNGVKTTREYSGENNAEAALDFALEIAEKYLFLQR